MRELFADAIRSYGDDIHYDPFRYSVRIYRARSALLRRHGICLGCNLIFHRKNRARGALLRRMIFTLHQT